MKAEWSKFALLTVCIFGGCNNPTEPNDSDASQENTASSSSAADQYPIPTSLVSSMTDDQRPATIEAFTAEFTSRFENDIYAPFIDLAHWGTSNDEQKQAYLEGVKSSYTMRTQTSRAILHSADDIEIHTVEAYGDWAFFPVEGEEGVELFPAVTHVIGITGHYGDDLRVTNYFAVGQHNGKFGFCTIVPPQ